MMARRLGLALHIFVCVTVGVGHEAVANRCRLVGGDGGDGQIL
jgi:hypothetical protein